jgi:hypothetical protein
MFILSEKDIPSPFPFVSGQIFEFPNKNADWAGIGVLVSGFSAYTEKMCVGAPHIEFALSSRFAVSGGMLSCITRDGRTPRRFAPRPAMPRSSVAGKQNLR